VEGKDCTADTQLTLEGQTTTEGQIEIWRIGRPQDPNEGIRIIRSAIDRGITFMDNCWDYHNGESERRMGLALGDGYRQKVFLMTKFDGRTKDSTARQIDESLRRLHQMPLNLMDAHFRSFVQQVMPKLVEQEIAVLGMKSMGDGNLLKSGTVTAVECLHYALNLPVSVVITGCESMERLDQAMEAARTFRPSDKARISALLTKTRSAALTGKYEPFKTTAKFDGTANNPQWMA
jgi:predicted aldo/keto reductase-like oxidoreductase